MAHLYVDLDPHKTDYWDKKSGMSREEWFDRIRKSTTVYVGNLSFYTTEDQIYELFGKCGEVLQIVMGLNAKKKIPCGFAFVKFRMKAAAVAAAQLLNQCELDGRPIRVDWDTGEGIEGDRKYGRGDHGMQWRDEFRRDYDAARGGHGGGLDYDEVKERLRYESRGRGGGWRDGPSRPILGKRHREDEGLLPPPSFGPRPPPYFPPHFGPPGDFGPHRGGREGGRGRRPAFSGRGRGAGR
ncbi:unnamed protein product [Vitrella brassicaformis CCMP3155]|uniref:Nuclear cap-binding protein subunit 2 n=2 Tax=Vitrella brassicaformis TaxID=1169539 RepID=A0A0G4ESZ2_VITBC|nr:unnamed protein product [Vitrella brassicaformis CCMP3155]|eukprot:CEM01000.1 unnamed protein product [Vitrella brassicaformis CCMP3155]